ncbi:hypothetical protein UFOVP1419_15 [uncultured Caudovirales phage]|uniref:Uncharacterized protein n=1 Tax=uncultured Caudovirales phage TaxID=2100421 RepID=A0A6J5SDS6_9CAUD|nr:hypothetical protein UFOVP1419_15 [uncultured Caudovirales phage]
MSKRKKRNFKAYSQCDKCATMCGIVAMATCGRLEFEAIAEGTVHECPEFEAEYWDKLCA